MKRDVHGKAGRWEAWAVSVTVMVSATAAVAAAPQATASPPASVLLSTSSNALQPVIDQILAAQQAAVEADQALPFADPGSSAQLPTTVQNLSYQWLLDIISRNTGGMTFFQSPELVAGPVANSRLLPEFFSADIHYANNQGLDPDATYVLTGSLGAGTGTFSVSPLIVTSGADAGQGFALGNLETGTNLVVNPDGTFTIYISPDAPAGAVNYIDSDVYNDSTGAAILIRDYQSNWALGPTSFQLECLADCPEVNPDFTPTGISDTGIDTVLNTLNSEMTPINTNLLQLLSYFIQNSPTNAMTDLAPATGQSSAILTTMTSKGSFDLEPGQAMIVKVPDVPSTNTGIELMNSFASQLPTPLAQTTLNNSQAFESADGFTYYVISDTNPGVANWLDTGGMSNGTIYYRIAGVPEGTDTSGLPVETQIVPIDELNSYLPVDTPTVSPEQFAADMNERVLSFGYSLDINRVTAANPTWVTQQLWLHDLETGMGKENFEAVFGLQPSTPMWLRLTPALSPDSFTVMRDILTDPSGSLAAIQDNLDLAAKDISMPIELMWALLEKNSSQTMDAVADAFGAGQPMDALTALFNGGQQFAEILGDALFDPNTSITAGILNARDDLSTAIMMANGGFPTELGPLATWEWEHMSELTQITDSSSLLGQLGDLFGA